MAALQSKLELSLGSWMRDQLKRAFYFEEGPMYAQQCAHTHIQIMLKRE